MFPLTQLIAGRKSQEDPETDPFCRQQRLLTLHDLGCLKSSNWMSATRVVGTELRGIMSPNTKRRLSEHTQKALGGLALPEQAEGTLTRAHCRWAQASCPSLLRVPLLTFTSSEPGGREERAAMGKGLDWDPHYAWHRPMLTSLSCCLPLRRSVALLEDSQGVAGPWTSFRWGSQVPAPALRKSFPAQSSAPDRKALSTQCWEASEYPPHSGCCWALGQCLDGTELPGLAARSGFASKPARHPLCGLQKPWVRLRVHGTSPGSYSSLWHMADLRVSA